MFSIYYAFYFFILPITSTVWNSQSLSCFWLFVIPWNAAHQASLSFTISQNLFKFMSIESVMPSNYLILCCPCLLLPSVFASGNVFSNELALCIRWPMYWSFRKSPSNEYSGLISFTIDWFDLWEVQETLKSLLQHHSLKSSVPWHSVFFMVQLSHPYMTTKKTIALIIWIFCQQSDVKYKLWLSNLLEYFLELKVTLLKTL